MSIFTRPKTSIFIPALLAAATLIVYWAGLSGGFLFDDFPNLVLDPDWKATRLDWAQLERALLHGIASPTGRPLALISFAVNHALTAMDPFWLKFTSLLFHIGNGLLVWLFCRWLFTRLPLKRMNSAPSIWAATLVTAAWLLHPLQVSSVLYIVQRMELGAATGILLSLLAYARARDRQISRQRSWPWLLAAAGALLLGLGFKETAVLAPGFAFLLELFVLRFAGAGGRTSRGWVLTYSLGLVAAGAVFVLFVLPLTGPESYAIRDFDRGERMLTQLLALALYIQQILLPLPETMTFYYDNFRISRGMFSPPATAAAAILIAALLGLTAVCWRRWPLVGLGIGWFFMAHVLTSNVLPLELVFEHRNYLALLGLLLALVQPLHALGRHLHADARGVLAVLPVLTLAVLCTVQAATWGDPLRLAWTLENRNPDSPRATYGLGKELLLQSRDDPAAPAWSLARAQFMRAADLSVKSALPMQGVILMDGRQGRPIPAEQWQKFRDVLNSRPIGFEGLGALYAVSNCRITGACKFVDQELLRTFLVTVSCNPFNPEVHTLYANFAWNVLDDETLAISLQREAVRLSPNHAAFRFALAKFLLASGDTTQVDEGRKLARTLRSEKRDLSPSSEERELGVLEQATKGRLEEAEPAR